MNDGNKESVKELLGAFRIVASADLSILLAAITINSRTASFTPTPAYCLSLWLLAMSLITSVYLFLVCIRKISLEAEAIVEQPPVKWTAAAALLMLIAATALLILDMLT